MMLAFPLVTVRLLAAFALAAAAAAPLPASARRHEPSTGLRALSFAKAPPDFAYDAGSGTHRLDELRGKPVVLNFWATWCEPCRAELDAFAAIDATYGDAVTVLTVSYEAPGVARAFLAARHVSLTVVEDPDRTVFDAYSVTALPVTVVLAKDGTVAHVSVGEIAWDELHDALDATLAHATGDRGTLTLHPSHDTLAGNAGTQAP